MPEGPELKHSRDVLRNITVGKSIVSMSPTQSGRYAKKNPDGFEDIVNDLPLKVEAVDVKGKFMWWTLKGSDKTWYMFSTYGMSGQWSPHLGKHPGFIIELSDSGRSQDRSEQLFFNDQRRFGTIKFVFDSQGLATKLKSLGPDILDDSPMTSEIFAKRILLKPNRTISEALMDQSCVSGVGNYLRAEILFDCNLDPWRNVTEITNKEYEKLCEAIIRIAKSFYKSHGASIKTYRNIDGSVGTAQLNFKVYGCKICPSDHEITRRQDRNGRMMHWCSLCQK